MNGRTQPLRVLCIDHEGGHGGSSRSLFLALKHMDRTTVAAEVWCRRNGDVLNEYRQLGIPAHHIPDLPVWRADSTLRATVSGLRHLLPALWRHRAVTASLAQRAQQFDVVHFNYISLQPLLWRLNRRVPVVMHMRHWPYTNWMTKWEVRRLSKRVDRFVFITENERDIYRAMGGTGQHDVIYNVVEGAEAVVPYPAIPCDGRFLVGSIGNYAYGRGTDRLVEVAAALKARGRTDILFVVAGDTHFHPADPGELGEMGKSGLGIPDVVARRNLAGQFLFLGHVPGAAGVIAGCDCLVRLSRRDDTWGRDTLEAMAAGKPVVAVGAWDGFVESGKTGVRLASYDPDQVALALIDLVDKPNLRTLLGSAAKDRISRLCDPRARAADLARVWEQKARNPQRVRA